MNVLENSNFINHIYAFFLRNFYFSYDHSKIYTIVKIIMFNQHSLQYNTTKFINQPSPLSKLKFLKSVYDG